MGTTKTWDMFAGLAAYNSPEDERYKNMAYIDVIIDSLEKNMKKSYVEKYVEDKKGYADTSELLETFQNFMESQKERMDAKVGTKCIIHVYNEKREPLIAEIKIFSYKEDHLWNTPILDLDIEEIRKAVNFHRRITNCDGQVEIYLPKGNYEVMVSKGSEYEMNKSVIEILDSCMELEITLHQFIDLKTRNYYAGDLHHHSIFSSPLYGGTDFVVDQVEVVKQSMLAAGLSFGALSDHHNILNHRKWKELKSKDFMPIVSKEISTSNGHVLALGVEEDVIYLYPTKEQRCDEYLRGEFIRITDQIKMLNGLPQLNHPRDAQTATAFNPEFHDIIDIFEIIEIWNGAYPFEYFTPNQKAFQLWLTLLDEERYIPATTGSDTHDVNCYLILSNLDRIIDFIANVKDSYELFTNEVKQMADVFFDMVRTALPTYIRWNRYNCSSGGIRTYLHLTEGEVSKEVILNHLRLGHSFLTNGPIIIPNINGKGPGETVTVSQKNLKIHITILSNRKLNALYLWKSKSEYEKIKLPEKQKSKDDFYDYTDTFYTKISGKSYVVFMVKEDCSCMAITNPIFIKDDSKEC